jgi:hypothetical protein
MLVQARQERVAQLTQKAQKKRKFRGSHRQKNTLGKSFVDEFFGFTG